MWHTYVWCELVKGKEVELHSFELGTDWLPVHYVRLNEAIEIVKQCGVSEEVCECRKLKDYNILFETSCGCILAIQEFKYCPYCGKKIKIVGDWYGMVWY